METRRRIHSELFNYQSEDRRSGAAACEGDLLQDAISATSDCLGAVAMRKTLQKTIKLHSYITVADILYY